MNVYDCIFCGHHIHLCYHIKLNEYLSETNTTHFITSVSLLNHCIYIDLTLESKGGENLTLLYLVEGFFSFNF